MSNDKSEDKTWHGNEDKVKLKGARKRKRKIKKKRALSIAKRGGFLPFLLPALSIDPECYDR